jgi:hypothetical protein
LPTKPNVERAGERRLDDAGIRAGMSAGIAAYHPERVSGEAADQRRPSCCGQPGKSRWQPVGQVIQPGGRPSELQIARRAVPDHRIQGVGSSISKQSRQAGDGPPQQRSDDGIGSILRHGFHSGSRYLIR